MICNLMPERWERIRRNRSFAAARRARAAVATLAVWMLMAAPAHAQNPATQNPPAQNPSAGVNGDWWAQAQKNIAAQEYHVTWQEKVAQASSPAIPNSSFPIPNSACYQAPNRAQNLRTYFTPAGPRVVRRTENPPTWVWGLELVDYGWAPEAAEESPVEPSFTKPLPADERRFTQIADSGNSFSSPEEDIRVDPRQSAGSKEVFESISSPTLSIKDNRVEYRRADGLTEWYVNDAKGLEQGFTIAAPPVRSPAFRRRGDVSDGVVNANTPAKAGTTNHDPRTTIHLNLAVRGNLVPSLTPDGQTVEFLTTGGVCVMRYGGLKATDANGKSLPTTLALVKPETQNPKLETINAQRSTSNVQHSTGNAEPETRNPKPETRIELRVTAASAAFPITIDPLASSVGEWTAESNQVDARIGYSVSTAGDVNGDGYGDVIVGAVAYDNGETDEGRAYVYYGSASGLVSTAAWTAESNQANAGCGHSVSTAGDVNGDGYADVIVGVYLYNNGQFQEGRAYVYHGSAMGLSASPDWTAESDQASAHFGEAVSTAGDVNGDGYADVIVGARLYDNGQTDEGRVFVYHGSASGLSISPDWTAESDQTTAEFGYSVSTAGDVNGDGFADIIVGADQYDNGQTDEGRAFVYHGSASGLSALHDWTAESDQAGARFGISVSTAGDVNGDGYADVIVGAVAYDNGETDEGRAYVYHGSASGLSASSDWTVESNQADALLGYYCGVSTAGDVNGDGYSDVIVGAAYYDNGQTDEGRAYLYLGSASGLSISPDWTAESDQTTAEFGYSVSTAGDVNGDGFSDIIVGAQRYDNGQTDEGRVWVFYGSRTGPGGGTGTSADWIAEGNQASAGLGCSASTAGDINGDGYDDVIIGAYSYDNGETDEGRAFVYYGSAAGLSATPTWTAESNQAGACLAGSVASAGDVNGDGFGDVIISAANYNSGQTDEGKAFAWYGSPNGLGPNGTPANADWSAEIDQAGAEFSGCVATAGDVNGDGYSDVVIGAQYYDNGQTDEGGAWVYLGSVSGLSVSPQWHGESDQAGARYGVVVASTGDVNKDGYSDIIVGGHLYANPESAEGRAWVYHGSPSGVQSIPAWTMESNQTGAQMGIGVASAGDVNGDGFDDAIIGSFDYTNGQTKEGAAFLFLGSAAGLTTNSVWMAEGNQAYARFGWSVADAGDVNGDGFDDVIVGAMFYDNGQTNEGRAYLYLGCPTGLQATPAWTFESGQSNAELGSCVASAGDVNGDGFSDLIVTAANYDNGETDEGRAFVYYGSAAGPGFRADWTAEGNQASAHDGFSLSLAGDVNGDGYDDVIVGAQDYDNGQSDEGRAFVYQGSASGLSAIAAWTAEGDQADANFGVSVATAGDVNGDGYSDVIVGARYYDNGETDEGRAYVYHGSSSGLAIGPANWSAESDQAYAYFGESVATAGDVNGDGYSDVVVGAKLYDNGQTNEGRAYVYQGSASGLSATAVWTAESDQASAYFGNSVASAEDVNGDGYCDVIVGANGYDNGETDEGRAYVYHGSASGLSVTAAWTAESDQAGAEFGARASTAGDVNGDGYSDVIVGAYLFDNGQTDEGRAYVYHGSASGLSATAAWTAESDQANAYFGISVATAGDVNGDGYSDVIAGAYNYDNGESGEGRAYLYRGSSSGLGVLPFWIAEGNQTNAQFGYAVSTAGDVNGDGYSDIIVGSPYYDNGETDEGKVFVYYGGPLGRWAKGTEHAKAGNAPNEDFGSVVRVEVDHGAGAASTDTVVVIRTRPRFPTGYLRVLPVHWRFETDRTAGPMSLTFHYLNSEAAGFNEAGLIALASADGTTGTWTLAGAAQTVFPTTNAAVVTGLSPAPRYFCLVQGATTPPTMIPEPLYTSGTQNAVSWSATAEATSYTVQCDDMPTFVTPVASADVSSPTLSHTFMSLNDGQTYWYRARAFDADGATDWSAATSSTQDATPPSFSNIAANPPTARLGAAVTISFTASEALAGNPTVTVNGHATAGISHVGNDWSCSYTIQGADPLGNAAIDITGTDLVGYPGSASDTTALRVTQTIYVDTAIGASGNGSSWAQAKKTITEGLAIAVAGNDIWVAKGRYMESIALRSDVWLYGGFASTETLLSQRDPAGNVTIIDASTADAGGPADHAVMMDAITNALLDGFTVTGGNANGGGGDNSGGGLFCRNLDATNRVVNCFFLGNMAMTKGGGAYCETASTRFVNCVFRDGAAYDGGAIACSYSSIQITSCSMSGNRASHRGGGVSLGADNYTSTATLEACALLGNRANDGGGAILMEWSSFATIADCVMAGNWTSANGGAIRCNFQSMMEIERSILSGNEAGDWGGAIDVDHAFSLAGCVLSGNRADSGAALNTGSCSPLITNCVFSGNQSTVSDQGSVGWATAAPTISNTVFHGNGGAALNQHDMVSTLVLRNCLFFGNPDGDLMDAGSHVYHGATAIEAAFEAARNNVDGDPRFVQGLTGTWTQPPLALFEGGTTMTRLVDAAANYPPQSLAGRLINSDTSQRFQSYITSNTATAILVVGDVTGFVAFGDYYRIIDYHLAEGSPAVDAGDNNAPGLPSTDIDGDPRIMDGIVDIGVDEQNLPPRVLEAVYNDSDDDGLIEAGESLTLIMSRGVEVTTSALNAADFYLPVSGDSLGGAGFAVGTNPNNSRHIVLTLGATPKLTMAEEFSTATLAPGSPSGIDLAAARPPLAIRGLTGAPAVDGGVAGVDDWGADLFFTCVPSSATIGTGGGSVKVAASPNAAYTQHQLTIPAEALVDDQRFTLRPPEENLGVVGAVQIDVEPWPAPGAGAGVGASRREAQAQQSRQKKAVPLGERDLLGDLLGDLLRASGDVAFPVPATLTLEYRDSDVDREKGQVEAAMKVHQLVENPAGVLAWKTVPGAQNVDMASNTVTVAVDSLNPCLSLDAPRVFAVLPGETIEPRTYHIKPQTGGLACLSPGPGGDYTQHCIDLPNYVIVPASDPKRIEVSFSAPTLADLISDGGRSFPPQSCALFKIETKDAFGQPIAFTDPVDVTVQYMDGTQNDYNDLVDFNGVCGPAVNMRIVYDAVDGGGVDFQYLDAANQTVNPVQKTVEAAGVTNLTGPSGMGVWGAAIRPSPLAPGAEARLWQLYE